MGSSAFSAARSRRRRILAITSASAESVPVPTTVEFAAATCEGETFAEVTTPRDHIREMLDDTVPRTWLFVGDNLGYAPQLARRSHSEFFGDVLRTQLGRHSDVVVDTTVPDCTIRSLRAHAEWRIARFQPDVVFWMPSLEEVTAGPRGRQPFELALRELAFFLRAHGAMLVVATPPLFMAATREPYTDLPAYVSLIKDVARELDLILVDHWKYWQLASQSKSIAKWIDSEGAHVLLEGHRKLARLLLHTLGIPLRPSQAR